MVQKKRSKIASLSSVLVAVDGSSSDEKAVRLACDLVEVNRGTVYIVYIIGMDRIYPVDAEVVPETSKGEAILKMMEEMTRSYRCVTKAILLQSRKAGPALIQEAVDKKVQALVLGSMRHKTNPTSLLGETIPYVIINAPCDVILWHKNRFDDKSVSNISVDR